MSVIVKDRMPQFKRSLYHVLDEAFKEGARDTLINAREKAPYKKGGLRSNSMTKQIRSLHWRVTFWIEYARFQEFGGDGKRKVRNYTTAGTGKGFLRKSGDEQIKKLKYIVRKHTMRVKA